MPKPGYLSASTFDALMSSPTLATKKAMAPVYRLVLDWLGVEREEITAKPLEYGKNNEVLAIWEYEQQRMCDIKVPKLDDFKISPTLAYVGGRTDGLLLPDGGIEVKCPYDPVNHLDINALYNGSSHTPGYKWQVCGYIWIYELEWMDFISFDYRQGKEENRLRVMRVFRDELMIKKLESQCAVAFEKAAEIYTGFDGGLPPMQYAA